MKKKEPKKENIAPYMLNTQERAQQQNTFCSQYINIRGTIYYIEITDTILLPLLQQGSIRARTSHRSQTRLRSKCTKIFNHL